MPELGQVAVMQALLARADLTRGLDDFVPTIDFGRGNGLLWLCGPRVLIRLCLALHRWLREAASPPELRLDQHERFFHEARRLRLATLRSVHPDSCGVQTWLRQFALGVHDRRSLQAFVEAVLDHRAILEISPSPTLIQFVGTCDPFHSGHRQAMA
jgi:hypothetical protein